MIRFFSLVEATFLLLLVVLSTAITGLDLCAYHTPDGIRIRLGLKPSLNSNKNFLKTVNLTNVTCCSHPDRKCTPPRPLAISLDNVVSLLEYPIRPTSIVVQNRMTWDFATFQDELWYSLYEFQEPSMNQSLDVHLTFGQPDAMTQSVFTRLNLNDRFKSIEDAEAAIGLHLRPRPLFDGDTDHPLKDKKFLLIPEVADDRRKISQTNVADRLQYLVLDRQTLATSFRDDLDNFDEKACSLGVTTPCVQQRCVNVSCVYRSSLPDELFSENQYGRAQNQSKTSSLNSYGTLNDPQAISRDRKVVAFNSEHSILLTVSLSSDGNIVSALTDATMKLEGTNSSFGTSIGRAISLSHAAATNYILATMWYNIRDYIDTITRQLTGPRFQGFLEPFRSKWFSVFDWYYTVKGHFSYIIRAFDLWMAVVEYIKYTVTSLEDLWSSLVADLDYAVDELSVMFRSFSTFDGIPFEKTIDHGWNRIWSSTSTEAIETDILKGDLYHIEITILLLSAIVDTTIGTIVILSLMICFRPRTSKVSPHPSGGVACKDDVDSVSSEEDEYDTVSTGSTDIAVTESFHSAPLTPRDHSSSMFGVDLRSRLNVFLKESASWSSFSRRPVNDQISYDSDYTLERCLSERDVTTIKYRGKTHRSIITLNYKTSLIRDHDASGTATSGSDGRSTSTSSIYQSDSYEESLTSTTFSSNMLSPSSAISSISLTSLTSSSASSSDRSPSSCDVTRSTQPSIRSHDDDLHDAVNDVISVDNRRTNSHRGMSSSPVSSPSNHDSPIMDDDSHSSDISVTSDIIEARVATGDAPNVVTDDQPSIGSVHSLRCIASAVAVGVANYTRIDLPLFPDDDLFTDITDQITGTGYLPNGLLYPNLEEAFIFLSLAFIRHRIAN